MSSGGNNNNHDYAESWTTQGLLDDPVISPEVAAVAATTTAAAFPVPSIQQQEQQQQQQPRPPAQQQQEQRKRSRSPAPPTTTSSTSSSNKRSKKSFVKDDIPDCGFLAKQLTSDSTTTRNDALKTLLQLSSMAELNYSLATTTTTTTASGTGGDASSSSGSAGSQVLTALVDIVHRECLDYESFQQRRRRALNQKKEQELSSSSSSSIVLSAKRTWMEPPTKERQEWVGHVRQQLARPRHEYQPKLLQTILIILRNLSFVSSNVRLMRQHDDIWSILIACLYEHFDNLAPTAIAETTTTTSSSTTTEHDGTTCYNLALHAMYTLLNMAQQPHLDVTGQLTVCDELFKHNSSLFDLGWGGMQWAKRLDVKEDVVDDVSTQTILEHAGSHLVQVWTLFSALRHVVTNVSTPRSLLLLALDFMKECLDQVGGVVTTTTTTTSATDNDIDNNTEEQTDVPNMADIFRELPSDVVRTCVDCLYVPRLGPDALDYVNPLRTMVARVSPLKLRMGKDATVDTDLRDRALDVLVPWVSLDESTLSAKLGRTLSCDRGTDSDSTQQQGRGGNRIVSTRFYHALLPILSTRVGRNEAPLLATELLKYMASSRDNDAGLLYIQDDVLELASRDARVAQLAFSHLYKNNRNVVEDDDEEEERSSSNSDVESEDEQDDSLKK